MKYVLIHGTMGHPGENWFPRLKQMLEGEGHEVWVPALPTPEGQTLERWCEEMRCQVPFVFDEETVLVGHSLGALYILHLLDRERSVPIARAVLVSGFVAALGIEEFDRLNESFLCEDRDWERIRSNCEAFVVVHGDDDPYVSLAQGELLAEQLCCDLQVIAGGGHLNESAGYVDFEELLGVLS